MRIVDIIMKKRGSILNPRGDELTQEELEYLVGGYVRGEIPDYQISSWLMAVYFNGMTFDETGRLTRTMLNSGMTIDLSSLKGPFVDKHSTGGVGDKLSLPLAPIAAACGLSVPMMSGRALGHTGGTLDKLESIDGYRTNLSPDEFRSFIKSTGYAMTGQTKEIVPADRLLYALRDVTGTVESIPLITASILSKKVAEGSEALVFDVKYGSGAFMKTTDAAEELANSLVKTAASMGKKASALITNMNTPLGFKIGNFLEIEESIECLQGNGPDDVMEATYMLGAHMLMLGNLAKNEKDGIEKCKHAVSTGKALKLFLKNVSEQGGNPELLMEQIGKRRSPYHAEYTAKQSGYILIDAYKTGLAGVNLGVGRNRTDEKVCPDAGIILKQRQGCYVEKGSIIMDVYGKDKECLSPAFEMLDSAVTYQNEKPFLDSLIYKTIQ